MHWAEALAKILDTVAWPLVTLMGLAMFRGSLIRLLPKLVRLKAGATGAEMQFAEEAERVRMNAENLPASNDNALPSPAATAGDANTAVPQVPTAAETKASDADAPIEPTQNSADGSGPTGGPTEGTAAGQTASDASGPRWAVTRKTLDAWAADEALDEAVRRPLTDFLAREKARSRLNELAALVPDAAVVVAFRELEIALRDLAVRYGYNSTSAMENARTLVTHGALPQDFMPVFTRLRDLRNQAAHTSSEVTTVAAYDYVGAVVELLERISTALAAAPQFLGVRTYHYQQTPEGPRIVGWPLQAGARKGRVVVEPASGPKARVVIEPASKPKARVDVDPQDGEHEDGAEPALVERNGESVKRRRRRGP